jgi:hypothetical protein
MIRTSIATRDAVMMIFVRFENRRQRVCVRDRNDGLVNGVVVCGRGLLGSSAAVVATGAPTGLRRMDEGNVCELYVGGGCSTFSSEETVFGSFSKSMIATSSHRT